ncbi:MAG: hypothetical protein E8D41_13930 [Nitrospira sp.]|nr:MAG: hypothetical protein E8D41_13930 [Nitrospira sp.]
MQKTDALGQAALTSRILATNQTTTFTYDIAGRLATTSDQFGNTTTRVHDNASRIIDLTDPRAPACRAGRGRPRSPRSVEWPAGS